MSTIRTRYYSYIAHDVIVPVLWYRLGPAANAVPPAGGVPSSSAGSQLGLERLDLSSLLAQFGNPAR